MAYWTANFPFDTVKSIIQTEPANARTPVARIISKLYLEKGIRGFYQVRGTAW